MTQWDIKPAGYENITAGGRRNAHSSPTGPPILFSGSRLERLLPESQRLPPPMTPHGCGPFASFTLSLTLRSNGRDMGMLMTTFGMMDLGFSWVTPADGTSSLTPTTPPSSSVVSPAKSPRTSSTPSPRALARLHTSGFAQARMSWWIE